MGEEANVDETYFKGYEEMSVHELMLKDKPRNKAYREAIEMSVKDKVVLDIGTGPAAFLALLAARAGAKKVCMIYRSFFFFFSNNFFH